MPIAIDCDLALVAENERLVARAVDELGRVDIFAANAGVVRWAPFLEHDEATWTCHDLNLKGSFFGAQAAARQMIAQGSGGRIVFSSSVTGRLYVPGLAAYAVTKAGLRHMATVLGAELGSHGITVNAIEIGAIVNERNLGDDPDYAEHWAGVVPRGGSGDPRTSPPRCVYLVSDEAAG